MLRNVLHSKIHRATVTGAFPDYIGSITIDRHLLEASGMRASDQVTVANCRSGERLETYVFEGEPGSGKIELNGAAAHLFEPGDIVIIEPGGAAADGRFVLARHGDGWVLRQLVRHEQAWWLRTLNPGPTEGPEQALPDLQAVRGVVIQKAVPGRRRASKFYI